MKNPVGVSGERSVLWARMHAGRGQRFFTWGRVAPLGISLGILWILLRRIPLSALRQEFLELRWGWFSAAFCFFGIAMLLSAVRWHLMLRLAGAAVHSAATWRLVLIGHFFNTLLFGPAGGDVGKSILYARWFRRPTTDVLAACFLDRLLGAGGTVLFGMLTVIVALALGGLEVLKQVEWPRPQWWWFAGALFVLAAVLIWWRLPVKGDSFPVRLAGSLQSGLKRLCSAPRLALQGLCWAFLVQFFWCGILALNLQAVSSEPLPWGKLFWTFPLIAFVASAPVSVAGAGVRESSALVLLGLYDVPAVDAIAAGMLSLLIYFLWAIGAGAWWWREEVLCGRTATRAAPEKISAVIPVLDEAENLPATVEHLRAIPEISEIIVVDGGSQDGTREMAARMGCRVLSSRAGRGGQLRCGASAARGDVVLLVHADTWLPESAGAAILQCLQDRTVVGGGFWKRFRNPAWMMRGSRWRCAVRLILGRRVMGDQAMFVRREVLERIDGIPDWPLMEEFELCRRLRRVGRLALAGATVTTSARRFAALGPWRTYGRMWRVTWQYYLGKNPETLRRIYDRKIR